MYYINATLLFLWGIVEKHTKGIVNKFIKAIIFVQLYMFSVVRSLDLMPDTKVYLNFFSTMKIIGLKKALEYRWEDGFILLNYIIGKITGSELIYFFIMSFLLLIFVFWFVDKWSSNFSLSILAYVALGFFADSWNIWRLYCALSLLLLALDRYLEEKPRVCLLFILFAALFHKTALIFLVVFVLKRIKIKNITLLYGLIGAVVISIFSKPILRAALPLLDSAYEQYSNGGYSRLLFFAGVFIVIFLFRKKKKSDFKYDTYIKMLYIAILFQIVSLSFSILTRVTTYFSISIIMLIPQFVDYTFEKSSKWIANLIVCALLMIYMALYYQRNVPMYQINYSLF